jgi:hypothetical protein
MKGAQSPSAKSDERKDTSEDAFGFSKIMAALSKVSWQAFATV